MSKLRSIFAFLTTRPWLGYLVVFSFTLVLYGALQAHPSFKDPDSFYHAGLAVMTAKSGPVTDFVWLPFTILADSFADHHFLYHAALAPFIWLFGALAGLKVAAALFGALAVTAFYLAARTLRLRPGLPLVFALILATSMNFMFRMNLAKAASLSVLLLMLALAALARRQWWALFALGFIYVWTHGSWPLLAFVSLVFAAVELLRTRKWTAPACIMFAPLLGLVFGLVFNPFFPQNLSFYWHQTVHAALFTYGGIVNVGIEWNPYTPLTMFKANGAVFVALGITAATALGALLWRKETLRRRTHAKLFDRRSMLLALMIIAAVFCVMTLKSQRHIEYFMPLGLLFGAAGLDYLSRRYDLRKLGQLSLGGRSWFVPGLVAFVVLVFAVLAVRDTVLVMRSFHDNDTTYSWGQFESAAAWMHQHLPDGAVIFHGSWAEFPPLFYRAPEFRYVAGLDPTFLYLKDPARFVLWRETVEGRVRDVSEVVEFYDSKYVLVHNEQQNLADAVRADGDFLLVYEDGEVEIYMLFP